MPIVAVGRRWTPIAGSPALCAPARPPRVGAATARRRWPPPMAIAPHLHPRPECLSAPHWVAAEALAAPPGCLPRGSGWHSDWARAAAAATLPVASGALQASLTQMRMGPACCTHLSRSSCPALRRANEPRHYDVVVSLRAAAWNVEVAYADDPPICNAPHLHPCHVLDRKSQLLHCHLPPAPRQLPVSSLPAPCQRPASCPPAPRQQAIHLLCRGWCPSPPAPWP